MDRVRTDVAGAVYGQILVTAVLVAVSEDKNASLGEILLSVAVTMLVFWLAHVYANWLATRVTDRAGWAELRAIAAEQWPIVQAAVPTLVVLALGAAGVFTRNTAVNLAIAAGVVGLAAWGLVIARRSGQDFWGTLAAVAISAAFGAALVMLKLLVH